MTKFEVGDLVTGTIPGQWVYGHEFIVAKIELDPIYNVPIYKIGSIIEQTACWFEGELKLVKPQEWGDLI